MKIVMNYFWNIYRDNNNQTAISLSIVIELHSIDYMMVIIAVVYEGRGKLTNQ